LALILPSIEEQWGLVVNEALAMGVPILCSDNVGARDSLVRTSVNGYVFESDNAEGLAQLMTRMATDEHEWRRLAVAAGEFAYKGDVCQFVSAVANALGDAQPLPK
ncbi:MAG TPA: glycosyltransferase, partial [Steroidobacteraceae bacterium]